MAQGCPAPPSRLSFYKALCPWNAKLYKNLKGIYRFPGRARATNSDKSKVKLASATAQQSLLHPRRVVG
eukprot:8683714-Karenia_brevis.AAC.1